MVIRPYGLELRSSDWRTMVDVEHAVAVQNERLSLLGCACASCSTAGGLEFGLGAGSCGPDGRTIRCTTTCRCGRSRLTG